TQMKYKRDNTGRGVAKGGTGVQYQLTSGHETRMLYTTPTERELRRLFGSEVGHSKHYKKNIAIDQNGQGSAVYISMSGKVIATSLIGPSPTNVIDLGAQVSESTTNALTIDEQDSKYLSQSINIIPNLYEEQNCILKYGLEGIIYDFEEIEDCKVCRYELEIYVTDPCDEKVMLSGANGVNYDPLIEDNVLKLNLDGNPDPQNPTPGSYFTCEDDLYPYLTGNGVLQISVNFNQIGEYKVHKILRIKPFKTSELIEAAEGALDVTLNGLQQEIFDNLDEDACLLTCDEFCYQSVVQSMEGATTEEIEDAVQECIQENCYELSTVGFGTVLEDECGAKVLEMENQIDQLDWQQSNEDDIVDFNIKPTISFGLENDVLNHFLNSALLYGEDYSGDGQADPAVEIFNSAGELFVFYVVVDINGTEGSVVSQHILIDATGETVNPETGYVINETATGAEVDQNGFPIQLAEDVILYPRLEMVDGGDIQLYEVLDKVNFPNSWQPQFSKSIISAHREYCLLEYCVASISSTLFTKELRDFTSLADAAAELGVGATFKKVFQNLSGTTANQNLPPLDPFFGGPNGAEELCEGVAQEVENIVEDFELWFENGAEAIQTYNNTNSTNLEINLYGILAMLEAEGGEDMMGYDEQTLWYLFVNIYQWMKEKALYLCIQDGDDCQYLEADGEPLETAIFKTNSVAWTLDSYEEAYNLYLSQSNINATNNQFSVNCDEQVENWDDIYQSFFDTPVPMPTFEGVCQEIVGPFDEGSCIDANEITTQAVLNIEDYTCGPNTFFVNYIGNDVTDVVDEYNSDNASFNLLDYNDAFNLDEYSNDPNCYYGQNQYERSFLIRTGAAGYRSRVIIHTNNCEGPLYPNSFDAESINVTVYNADNIDNCQAPLISLIECKNYMNVYGDLVLEYDSPSDYVLIKVGTTIKYDAPPTVRMTYFKDYKYQFIDQSTMRLRYFDFVTNDFQGGEDVQESVIDSLWPSDEPCGEINTGLSCIFESLKGLDIDLMPNAPPSNSAMEIVNITSDGGCFTNLKMFYLNPLDGPSEVWLEIDGSVIFPNATKFWFLSEDLTADIFQWGEGQVDVKLVSYGLSKYNYEDLDPYIAEGYITSSGPVSAGATTISPNVQLLFKSKNANGADRFIRAFPVFENKLTTSIPEFITKCYVDFDPTAYYEDCIGELNSIAAEQAEELFNELVDEQATILLQEINCKQNGDIDIIENFSANYLQEEGQFTLYYYDQAGNLIQTVPPAGVNLVTDFDENGN
ncbi:MAG: hypothetical protein P1U56_26720, partial [Saprospiraceae bacterium]|nr:hypothetical protein [Saprospiraceae bacterium]